MAKLIINSVIAQQMFDHAKKSFPEECCGFLFGTEDESNTRTFSEIMIVDNVKDENRKRRFEIDPLDYLKAEKEADRLGLKLLSIYHTHPNHPARPSEHDRVQAVPFFSYIIMSVTENDVVDITSWQLNNEKQFYKENLEIDVNNISIIK